MGFTDSLINDVTTSPEAAPDLGAGIPRYPRGDFASKQKKLYPEVQPLPLELPADKVFEAVKSVAAAMEGWTIEETDPKTWRLRAIARTKFLHFKDDVVIVVESKGPTSVVQMRSRSRLGKGDLGANAKRIVGFLGALKAKTSR